MFFPCQTAIGRLLECDVRVLLVIPCVVTVEEESQTCAAFASGEGEVIARRWRHGISRHIRPAFAIPHDVLLQCEVVGHLASVSHAVEDGQVGGGIRADDGKGCALARPVLNDKPLEGRANGNGTVGHGEGDDLAAFDGLRGEVDGGHVAALVGVVGFLQAPLRVGLPVEDDGLAGLAVLRVAPCVLHG